MIAQLQCIVLDCPDPMQLAEFYRSLLGGTVNQPDRRWSLDDDWATLHTPSGPVLAFQRVADYRPPRWPDPTRPQQLHLDFGVEDVDRAQEEALAAGATLLDAGSEGRSWRVCADPAGHPFCLVRH
ncbi:VOC family protein [Streptomyces phyllanthi]|uniref:VOC family protein n=1 Tax=Streptomyces phyllanthi TaxID=1803180 RepID=A0A5N8WBC4_9ACTN|nr:VOC family protein [Streptomyces phyllanthi]MPY44432.1 VOC family protein [Streptomyces phyllanthi]